MKSKTTFLNCVAGNCLLLGLLSTGAADQVSQQYQDISKPQPMRTERAIVYQTPVPGTVLLQFKLFDNQTWCTIYMKTSTWAAIEANDGKLPADAEIGSFQCDKQP